MNFYEDYMPPCPSYIIFFKITALVSYSKCGKLPQLQLVHRTLSNVHPRESWRTQLSEAPTYINTEFLLLIIVYTSYAYGEVGRCLREMGSAQGEGAREGQAPPDKGRDKQSNHGKEWGNMEQEEERKKSQAWRRGPSVHRVSILKGPLSMYFNVISLSMMLRLMLYLFQDNKSYGIKNHLHSSSDVCHCTSHVTSGTWVHMYSCTVLIMQRKEQTTLSTYCNSRI
jgi:hypothetical protein